MSLTLPLATGDPMDELISKAPADETRVSLGECDEF
jgi:hypothetical protein